MSRYCNDLEIQTQDAHAGVVAQGQVTPGDALVGRAANPRSGGFLELLDTTDMVVMVMGNQNVAQLPARVPFEPGQHRCRIAWVDHRTALVGRIL
ncbi:hypothetical protein D3C76_1263750 [compost metagenome]